MPSTEPEKPARRWLRPALLLGLVAAGIVLLRVSGLAAHLSLENLQELARLVRGLGWIAPAAYVALWVVTCLFFLPGLPVTLLGAVIFGAWWGALWVVVGANLGANLAFLAARYAVRPLMESWAGKNPLFRRIDEGVARHGWRMVMVTRLVPLFPFNLQNYAYGLTRLSLPTYALVSLVCMLPGTLAYCFAGGAVVSGQGNLGQTLLYLGLGAVFFVAVSLLPGLLRKKVAALDPDAGPADASR
ncbi:MAG: TVP38/TMEM64 family protein [Deltaproteobacteria bacterium]|nr:TVP38/TMEM64 family protein [Deltaproteobacteria bacterium]